MTPSENPAHPAAVDASHEKNSTVTSAIPGIRQSLRAIVVGCALATAGVGGYIGYTHCTRHAALRDGVPFFDRTPDGKIDGKELVYVDEVTGEEIRATIHLDAQTLLLEINGETFISRETIRPFIVSIRKAGRMIVVDLAFESTIEVPSQTICVVGKTARVMPHGEIIVSSAYELKGPICLVPKMTTKGTRIAPLVRTVPNGQRVLQ